VATGLRWMLASRSVVMMVPPRREIWSMESLLRVSLEEWEGEVMGR
jgi:hypothetical protein